LTIEGSLTAATETTVGNATSIGIGVNRIEIGVFAASERQYERGREGEWKRREGNKLRS
jgi:hypothetical protein